MMRHMPAIPESTRSSIILRLLDHAEKNWPQLDQSPGQIPRQPSPTSPACCRGGEQIPLFRLRYGGSAHSFGFAIYSAARDRYEDAVLLTGLPSRHARKKHSTPPALSTSQASDTNPKPPTNLRCHPLSLAFNLCCLPGSSLPVLSGVSP